MNEPIVSEIHDIREQLLREHQGDPLLYVRSAMKRQQERHPRFVSVKAPGLNLSKVSEPPPSYSS